MKTMSVQTLKERLNAGDVVLVDVREPGEHRSECIDGARLIPLGDVHADHLEGHMAVVLHCRSGQRSHRACLKLLEQNPALDIYNLEGGIEAWKQAGYDIEVSQRRVLPLDRQTHLVVGLLALLGFGLGTWVAPGYHALSALVGAGLVLAGLTGWCGMARLLALMPWNR